MAISIDRLPNVVGEIAEGSLDQTVEEGKWDIADFQTTGTDHYSDQTYMKAVWTTTTNYVQT